MSNNSNVDVSQTQNNSKIPSKRLNSLDFFKGLAIIIVYFYHLSNYWLARNWAWVNCATLFFTDVFGPSLFLFVSALAVTFSAKRKEGKVPDQIIRNRILTRGLVLMLISAPLNVYLCLTNVAIYTDIPFPLNLWGYNIIFFIGLSQIFSYISYRLGSKLSLIVGLLIIFVGPPLRELVFNLNIEMLNQNNFNLFYFILHYLMTSPIPQLPLFPWIAISFVATIFGDLLYKAWKGGTKELLVKTSQLFFFSGILFILIAVFYGYRLQSPDTLNPVIYPYIRIMDCANNQDIIPAVLYIGVPEFLIRSLSANMLYLMGVALIFIASGLYFLDFKQKSNPFIKMNLFYGKISLSLYFFVEFFAFFFSSVFPLWFFLFFYIFMTAFVGFLLYIWKKYFYNIGTFEWVVGQSCKIIQDFTYQRIEKE
ncbi:MAG: DUF1624 domain-containing protein [Promethearchaeota archaeon]|nr:MAG: DUF1624 domain-containing protein [Candidatus Lokiarchaeota archaeon]